VSDVSVVLCTYNGGRFVAEQLRTILEQTLPPAEIVIGDDGSTDSTPEVVDAVARTTRVPIRFHRNPQRLGFADNFLAACGRAAQPWIALADQDDRWAPTKLASARAAVDAHGAVLCTHAVDQIDVDGAPLGSPPAGGDGVTVVAPLTSDPWGNHYGFTMLFEKALLDRLPLDRRGLDPYDHGVGLSHDRWIYFLASTFGTVVVLDEVLASYRQHGAQSYGAVRGRSLRERLMTKLESGRERAEYLAGLSAYRAAVLAEPGNGDAADAACRLAGAAWWRAVEANLRRRGELCAPVPTTRRIRQLVGNVAAGTYGSFADAGFGTGRLAEDVLITAARLVRR
jgi:Glycosyl transferase family 2